MNESSRQASEWFILCDHENIYWHKMSLPWVPNRTLVLHGAGVSDGTRAWVFREKLLAQGIPSVAIDFSWHGRSSSNTPNSIQKRIYEAIAATSLLDDSADSINIIGFSMSWEVSIRLTELRNVRNLVLMCPGIYRSDVIDLPFGEAFSTKIREHESWRQSEVPRILSRYTGGLLLVTAELDSVIPAGVYDIILWSTSSMTSEQLVIHGAPHTIWKWMNENPERASYIAWRVSDYLR